MSVEKKEERHATPHLGCRLCARTGRTRFGRADAVRDHAPRTGTDSGKGTPAR
ncbi:hypothetical protein GCM10009799_42060 [Nocardiopsis rhodophaea]|uniref:Uncharacterized protein n=1 Tax=Nocardiopsis rhodophaea TaxID=280238 RepID=A0ABN2THF2_9ACTN